MDHYGVKIRGPRPRQGLEGPTGGHRTPVAGSCCFISVKIMEILRGAPKIAKFSPKKRNFSPAARNFAQNLFLTQNFRDNCFRSKKISFFLVHSFGNLEIWQPYASRPRRGAPRPFCSRAPETHDAALTCPIDHLPNTQ